MLMVMFHFRTARQAKNVQKYDFLGNIHSSACKEHRCPNDINDNDG